MRKAGLCTRLKPCTSHYQPGRCPFPDNAVSVSVSINNRCIRKDRGLRVRVGNISSSHEQKCWLTSPLSVSELCLHLVAHTTH